MIPGAALSLVVFGSAAALGAGNEAAGIHALKRAEAVCQSTSRLDEIQRRTQRESATLIRLGSRGAQMLRRTAQDRRRDWRFRWWAVELLGYIPDPHSVTWLAGVARDPHEVQRIRSQAVSCLVELRSPTGLLLLEEAYPMEKNAEIRRRMAEGMRKLRMRSTAVRSRPAQ